MIKTAKKLLAFLDAKFRLHVALLFVPMLCVALLEMASIGMILPFVQVLITPDGAGPVQALIDAILLVISPFSTLIKAS